MVKKQPKIVKKWPFMIHKFSEFFLPKLKKMKTEKYVIHVVTFDKLRFKQV